MACPFCGGDTQVVDSRERADFNWRRARRCLSCSKRFRTVEAVADPAAKPGREYIKRRVLAEPKSAAEQYRLRWEREQRRGATN